MFYSIAVAFLVLTLDQASKYFIKGFLSARDPIQVIKNIFHLTLTCNTGAAFSILQGGRVFFIIISLLCIVAIFVMLCRPKIAGSVLGLDVTDKKVKVAFGLILGGACGNLLDRLRFGCVVDFLDFRVWPVFNLADLAITIGAVLICWKMLIEGHRKRVG